MRRPAFVRFLAICIPLLLFAAPAVRAASIWTDGNGDGLPDAPGELIASPNTVVSVDVWIDSGTFAWTNFLAYVEWEAGCLTYVGGTYLVSGGEPFPIDNFSHPSGVGFGGYAYGPRQGLDALVQVSLRVDAPTVCCVTPIIDTNNPYEVFCQLGQGETYELFTEMNGSCWETTAQPGACCFVDGTCADLMPAVCVAQGGTPGGDGTACATTVCTPRTEACCYPDGSCTVVVLGQCPSGTVPQGDGSDCSTPCPVTIGACCYIDGTCASSMERIACEGGNGYYQGDGTVCADVTCTPRGACCYPSGSCTDLLTEMDCAAGGGIYQGDVTTCASVSCPQPTGACCLVDGTCQSLTAAECAAGAGVYQGDDTMCADVTCTPRGACCFASGSCSDGLTAEACAAAGGNYQGDVTMCADVTCVPRGACCLADSTCEELTAAECAAAGGSYRGNGSRCANVICFPPDGCSGASPWVGPIVFGGYPGELSSTPVDVIRDKNANLSGNVPNPPEVLVGGETCATATPIGVPGLRSGNTCSRLNDYDEACPYTGSTSGDEVYVITGVNGQVTIDLCNSAYDTKVYVYQGSCPGTLVACNDDACNDPSGNPYRSMVTCVNLSASNTYYIVVDGYFGDCGEYCLSTYFSTGCPGVCDAENCPPGAILEGEPVCGPNYVDTYNGGCNSTPNVFSNIPCDATVCGAGGNYSFNGLSYRETDWYAFNLPVAATVTATMCASFDAQLAAIDGNIGCGFITIICGSVFGPAGSTISCTYSAPAGLNWIFAATSAFSGVPCGSPYVLTLDCPGGPTATQSKTWGQIKGMFR